MNTNTKEKRRTLKQMRQRLKQENKRFGPELSGVPTQNWPQDSLAPHRVEVLRNRSFLVQVFSHPAIDGIAVLAVNRNELNSRGDFKDDITWNELMELKRQAGYAENDAVEVYPNDAEIMNVANLRWLFVFLNEKLPFKWTNQNALAALQPESAR